MFVLSAGLLPAAPRPLRQISAVTVLTSPSDRRDSRPKSLKNSAGIHRSRCWCFHLKRSSSCVILNPSLANWAWTVGRVWSHDTTFYLQCQTPARSHFSSVDDGPTVRIFPLFCLNPVMNPQRMPPGPPAHPNPAWGRPPLKSLPPLSKDILLMSAPRGRDRRFNVSGWDLNKKAFLLPGHTWFFKALNRRLCRSYLTSACQNARTITPVFFCQTPQMLP